MTHILHIHFNKDFDRFVADHTDISDAILSTVADTASRLIKNYSAISRCPARISDEMQIRVPSENLLIYAVLKKHVLIFMGHRKF